MMLCVIVPKTYCASQPDGTSPRAGKLPNRIHPIQMPADKPISHFLFLIEVNLNKDTVMDITRLLDETACGHYFVLVLVDTAIQYPESVPLPNIFD